MAKSEFRKYVDSAQSLPDDVILGNIVWHTVNDGAYSLDSIDKLFEALDMNPAFVPEPTSQFNAFEKACTKALAVAKPYSVGRYTHQIMAIREVVKTGEVVKRQLIREVRDSRAQKLRHEAVAEIVFYRPQARSGKIDRSVAPRIRPTLLPTMLPEEREHVQAVLDEFSTQFDRLYNFIDGDKLRGVVRNYLGFVNAVMMKSGVYFVHRNREDELEKLRTFVDAMGNGCKVELIPIPELKRLRESVIEAFQDEAVKELNEVVAAINKVRSTRATITMQAVAKLTEQYQQVMRKSTEYTRTLRCTQDRTAGAAEIALASLDALRADMQEQESK